MPSAKNRSIDYLNVVLYQLASLQTSFAYRSRYLSLLNRRVLPRRKQTVARAKAIRALVQGICGTTSYQSGGISGSAEVNWFHRVVRLVSLPKDQFVLIFYWKSHDLKSDKRILRKLSLYKSDSCHCGLAKEIEILGVILGSRELYSHVDKAHFLRLPGTLWLDILDILTATARRTEWRCPRVAERMRELDTESPVVWPAWCYSGESSLTESCFLKKEFRFLVERIEQIRILLRLLGHRKQWLLVS